MIGPAHKSRKFYKTKAQKYQFYMHGEAKGKEKHWEILVMLDLLLSFVLFDEEMDHGRWYDGGGAIEGE